MRSIIGVLGIMFIPFAVVVVAFRASCYFVSRWANKGLESFDD
jgi:hypothetical protein